MTAVRRIPDCHPEREHCAHGLCISCYEASRSRSRRKRDVRARTIRVKRMTKRELEAGRQLYPETDYWKPRTRAECIEGPRPCPYVSCQHHLYLDVSPRTGAIKLNFPDLEVWEMAETCALDVADRGGAPLESVGAFINLTRERVRQIKVVALDYLASRVGARCGRRPRDCDVRRDVRRA